jgi:hypothetical protein
MFSRSSSDTAKRLNTFHTQIKSTGLIDNAAELRGVQEVALAGIPTI